MHILCTPVQAKYWIRSRNPRLSFDNQIGFLLAAKTAVLGPGGRRHGHGHCYLSAMHMRTHTLTLTLTLVSSSSIIITTAGYPLWSDTALVRSGLKKGDEHNTVQFRTRAFALCILYSYSIHACGRLAGCVELDTRFEYAILGSTKPWFW